MKEAANFLVPTLSNKMRDYSRSYDIEVHKLLVPLHQSVQFVGTATTATVEFKLNRFVLAVMSTNAP